MGTCLFWNLFWAVDSLGGGWLRMARAKQRLRLVFDRKYLVGTCLVISMSTLLVMESGWYSILLVIFACGTGIKLRTSHA